MWCFVTFISWPLLLAEKDPRHFPDTFQIAAPCTLTVTHLHISGYIIVGAGERKMPVGNNKQKKCIMENVPMLMLMLNTGFLFFPRLEFCQELIMSTVVSPREVGKLTVLWKLNL